MTEDQGSVSVELTVLAPAVAVMLALVVFVGRVQSSRADIEAAAHSAARAITLARDPSGAVAQARAMAAERLRVGSPSCRALGWQAHITEADVTVTVSCDVDLSEAALLPVPGRLTVSATRTEVLDRFRENTGEFGMSDGSRGSSSGVGAV